MFSFVVSIATPRIATRRTLPLLPVSNCPLHRRNWHHLNSSNTSPSRIYLLNHNAKRSATTMKANSDNESPPNDKKPMIDIAKSRLVTYCTNRGVDKEVAARVIEIAQCAVRDWSIKASEFLTPPESVALETAITSLADVVALPWGGYDEAERRVLFIGHSELVESANDLKAVASEQVVLLKITGNFEFEKASHRDFMGAVLNAGISRQKIGDIIVQGQTGAQVMINGEVSSFLQTSVTSVKNVKVVAEVTSVDNLEIPEKRVKEVQSTESSMRMDAVVSAGFKVSRSKLADMARGGLVYVNYKEMRSPAKKVKSGDIVSVRGVGKLEIGECSTTSKGRFRILMKKYI